MANLPSAAHEHAASLCCLSQYAAVHSSELESSLRQTSRRELQLQYNTLRHHLGNLHI